MSVLPTVGSQERDRRLSGPIAAGSGHDAVDDCSLGISIGLNKRPFSLRQGPFRSSIQLAVRGVDAEPVSEHQHSVDLRTASGERVEVDVGVRPFEHPVLVPVSLSEVKSVARRRECRGVRRFVRGIGDDKNHVDDGFGG